jgi:glycogen operon protein
MVPRLATRLTGSSDLYLRDGRKPFHSINFVTSHDGFTLNDLVSYEQKHNQANGEGNRDGFDHNLSRNYGVEGPSAEPALERLRGRQVRNFLATLLLSLGTPMLLGGDELRRTQAGNNNAWCQNNEVSWFDWRQLETRADLHRFARLLIAFRLRHPVLRRAEFYGGEGAERDEPPGILWLAPDGGEPDWEKAGRALGCRLDGAPGDEALLLLFNAAPGPQVFRLPQAGRWRRAADTSLPSPEDIPEPGREPVVGLQTYTLAGRALAVLLSR